LPELINLAHSLGINKVKAYHFFSFSPELDKESLMMHLGEYEVVLKDSLNIGKELDIELELAEPPILNGEKCHLKPKACHLPWYESWIDIDGGVYPCHSNNGLDIGNIRNDKFFEIWNGDFYKKIRRFIGEEKPVWNCSNCGMLYENRNGYDKVPYDPENFLSPDYRVENEQRSKIRWSGRMKQFEINRSYSE
jgi:radical SAM protein with 4Fe4S-binding SPASM domain